ncbi:hypothetical protein [Maricaulis sp.]|uniref:hypothetical protein n=1 Tax=Maricaulis sp. TaxID=1486257 RepID=UPI003A95BBD4
MTEQAMIREEDQTVEITPEMVEAGVAVLLGDFGDHHFADMRARNCVSEIFVAMSCSSEMSDP